MVFWVINLKRRNFIQAGLVTLPGLSFFGLFSSLSGCQESYSRHPSIRVGITSRPRMLDPRKATDALSSRVNRLLYRQLIDFDEQFQAIPDLARWQQLTPTHYRFTLQASLPFHHGNSLTAHDVVATYQSVLDPSLGSAHRGSLKGIQKIVAVNEQQVDFILDKADALFVGRLVIGILPKELIDQNHAFHETPIGSGPCQFVSLSEQKLVLRRLSDETELVFVPVQDATVRVLKLQKGELDILQNDLSPELVNYCAQQEGLKVAWHNGTNFGYIGFNFEDELLAQPAMREALAYGIDRQAIIDSMFAGRARLAGGLLVPEHWSGAQDLHGYDYQPEKARKLLQQVQIPPGLVKKDANNQPFIELSYKTSNDPTRIRLATIYQSQLKKIGIHLNVQSYDWGTFYSDIKQGRFQLYSLAWVGVKSPDIFQYAFDSDAVPPSGANRGRYRDTIADRLIRQAGQTDSLEEQALIYQALQRRLQETLAVIPLWYEDQYSVMRSNMSDYPLYADGRLDGLLHVQKQLLPSG